MNRPLLWLCASTLLTVAGFAGALPAAATLMEQQGFSAGEIGTICSLVYAGVLCLTPFQPKLARRFGPVLTYQCGKVLTGVGFIELSLAHSGLAWSAATLLIGFGAGLTWPVTDSLVASFAPESRKGAWMGLFQTGMGAAFALGPFAAAAMADHPEWMFAAAAIIGLLTSLPLLGARAALTPHAGGGEEGLRAVLLAAPHLPVLAFIGGFFENGTHTAITLCALAMDWKGAAAISLAGVIGVGAFVVQYPIGKLADIGGAQRIVFLTLGVMLLSCLPLPLSREVPAVLWVIAFVWGAAGGCLYTLAMTGMAQRFTGASVAAATSLMVMGYTLGGITGPAAAGYAVQISPLLGPLALFVAASLCGMWQRRPSAQSA